MHWLHTGLSLALTVGAKAPVEVQPAVTIRHVVTQTQQTSPSNPDSLMAAAQEALTHSDYRATVTLLRQVVARYPSSRQVPMALYFEAFALRRLGTDSDLHQALQALHTLRTRFPKLANEGDIGSLEVSIQGDLARRGDPAAAEAVTKIAERRPAPRPDQRDERCPEENQEENQQEIAALSHLQKVDAARTVELIRKVLAERTPETVCKRRLAILVLAQLRNIEGAEALLLDVINRDPDAQVRGQAVIWLSAVGGDQAVDVLALILQRSDDSDLRNKAIFALGEHNSARARQALKDYIERNDAPDDARSQAIHALGRFPSEETSEYLRGLYDRVESEEVKLQIIAVLGDSRQFVDRNWLIELARNDSQSLRVRGQALFQASQAGEHMAELIAAYSIAPPELREVLIYIYAQREEPAAFDKLLEIAKQDLNRELREKALFWLQRSRDPRAALALRGLNRQR